MSFEILILTKDRLPMLKNALESVLRQTVSPVRITVIDNASRDGTAEYVKELSVKYDYVSIFSHPEHLVEWLFAILSKGHVGRPYNVGSSVGISIMDLAKLVKSTLATHNISIKVIVEEQHKQNNVYVPIVDRAKNELKLSESISLCDAIVKSADSRRLFAERMS